MTENYRSINLFSHSVYLAVKIILCSVFSWDGTNVTRIVTININDNALLNVKINFNFINEIYSFQKVLHDKYINSTLKISENVMFLLIILNMFGKHLSDHTGIVWMLLYSLL
jgi:hypothetical protein